VTFRFRMQRVLELREQAEQARAQALARAEQEAEAARQARDAIAALHDASRAELFDAHQGAPRVGHLQQVGLVVASLADRLRQADEQVAGAEAVVAEAQRALHDASRERRVLDRLKDRQAAEWRTGVARQARHQMDEIALSRFTQRGDGTGTPRPAGAAPTDTASSDRSA
jgi:flagellar FliJ protein